MMKSSNGVHAKYLSFRCVIVCMVTMLLPTISHGVPLRMADAADGIDLQQKLEQTDFLQSKKTDYTQLMEEGGKETPEQVIQLEALLKQDPSDLATRLRLMGYHQPAAQRKRGERPRTLGTYGKLVLGIIEHHPQSQLARETGMLIIARYMEVSDKEHYWEEGAEAWREHVKKHPDTPGILGNAGIYFIVDPFRPEAIKEGKNLLDKAYTLEPENPVWLAMLARVSYSEMSYRTPRILAEDQREETLRGLNYLEKYHLGTREISIMGGDDLLYACASTSFSLNEMEKAKRYAHELLQLLLTVDKGWDYGNLFHKGHILLGRIAIEENNLDKAKEHLRKAAQTPGSPQLNSFGPDFSLACEVLKLGGKESVLQYLDQVAQFWAKPESVDPSNKNKLNSISNNAKKLEKWKEEINNGNIPQDRKWQRHIK